jgi:hypothetical protein
MNAIVPLYLSIISACMIYGGWKLMDVPHYRWVEGTVGFVLLFSGTVFAVRLFIDLVNGRFA